MVVVLCVSRSRCCLPFSLLPDSNVGRFRKGVFGTDAFRVGGAEYLMITERTLVELVSILDIRVANIQFKMREYFALLATVYFVNAIKDIDVHDILN